MDAPGGGEGENEAESSEKHQSDGEVPRPRRTGQIQAVDGILEGFGHPASRRGVVVLGDVDERSVEGEAGLGLQIADRDTLGRCGQPDVSARGRCCAGCMLGFSGFTDGDDGLLLDRMFIDIDRIGRGLGRVLWQYAVQTARDRGASEFVIGADPNAASFYESMGAEWYASKPTEEPTWTVQMYRFAVPR